MTNVSRHLCLTSTDSHCFLVNGNNGDITSLNYNGKQLAFWETLSAALRAAVDRFEDGLLTAFDVADGKGDEKAMAEAAEASWEVWDGSGGEWELGRVWAEKLEIFYEQSKWKPLDNFTYVLLQVTTRCGDYIFAQAGLQARFYGHGRVHG